MVMVHGHGLRSPPWDQGGERVAPAAHSRPTLMLMLICVASARTTGSLPRGPWCRPTRWRPPSADCRGCYDCRGLRNQGALNNQGESTKPHGSYEAR